MAGPLVHSTGIHTTPDRIYEALTTTAGLASFWTSDSQADPTTGSVATFGFGGPKLKMRVDELVAGQRVKWTCLGEFPNWNGTTVTWELSRAENGDTDVLFRHGGWPAEMPQEELASVNYTWALVLKQLKEYSETGKPAPLFAMAAR